MNLVVRAEASTGEQKYSLFPRTAAWVLSTPTSNEKILSFSQKLLAFPFPFYISPPLLISVMDSRCNHDDEENNNTTPDTRFTSDAHIPFAFSRTFPTFRTCAASQTSGDFSATFGSRT